MNFRLATEQDHDAIWEIFHEVVSHGDTYVFDPDISRQDALAYWLSTAPRTFTYVAEVEGQVLGTFLLKQNQPGLGSHVANASFMVSSKARGMGIGKAMGEHCIAEAKRIGFRAMQFNIVIATNEVAVKLWQQLGFQIVATLPGVFHHRQLGYVDAHVMFLSLIDK